jgi:bacteriorhodopsin
MAGSVLLLVIGIAFVSVAVVGWRRTDDPSVRARRLAGVVVNLLVGVVALADGAMSAIDEPARIVVWSIGSAALLVAATVLITRPRRRPRCRSESAGARRTP